VGLALSEMPVKAEANCLDYGKLQWPRAVYRT
jgi:hypothetical protein